MKLSSVYSGKQAEDNSHSIYKKKAQSIIIMLLFLASLGVHFTDPPHWICPINHKFCFLSKMRYFRPDLANYQQTNTIAA